jgi:hypothetical protein
MGPGLLCPFFMIKDSEEGIRAVRANAVKVECIYSRKGGEKYTVPSYKIVKCPKYTTGR